jgi:hypothetical protein
MKNLKHIFGLSLVALVLGACSDEVSTQYDSDSLAVHFNAQVGNLISRSASSTALSNGTAVNISGDGTNYYGYTSDANGNLTPTGSGYVRWPSPSASSINITAYTPVVDGATGTTFSLADYADQSAGSENADFASFDGTLVRTASNAVSFELQRRMTQVKVNIASVEAEYDDTDDDKYTFDVTIYSPSTSIAVANDIVTGSGDALEVTPYGGKDMTTATADAARAIITPGAKALADFIAVQVKKNGTAVGSKLVASERPALLAGYSYTFNVTVKKDNIGISSVKITDWESVAAIDGGLADEYVIDLDLDKYQTTDDVYAEVKRLSDMTVTSLKFKGHITKFLATGETVENTTALHSFFYDATNNNWVLIESIDLSGIEDLAAIPANSFYVSEDGPFYTRLAEVVAPQVEKIGDYAFYRCWKLASINAPKVESIGEYAFYYAPLTSIDFPVLKTIGQHAFCSANFTSVNLPSLTTIGDYVFFACKNLESIDFPAVTTIGKNAFSACSALTGVSLPNATTIGESAFVMCSAMSDVSLPNATTICDYAFNGCSSLKSISLPEAITIGKYSLTDCSKLTSIELPKATTIGDWAFESCTSLTSVSMPKATTFGYGIFTDCTTTNIILTLNQSQKGNVSGLTWTYSGDSSYKFMAITFKE